MIGAVSASVANVAIYPMQDVLGLGSEHRMNRPGETSCWTWRMTWDMVGAAPADRLARLCAAHGRSDFDRLRLGD